MARGNNVGPAEFELWIGTPNELALIGRSLTLNQCRSRTKTKFKNYEKMARHVDPAALGRMDAVESAMSVLWPSSIKSKQVRRWDFQLDTITVVVEIRRI